MTHKTFMGVATVVFSLVAIAHALRFVFGWPVAINNSAVPVWLSGIAALFAGYMAVQAYRFKK